MSEHSYGGVWPEGECVCVCVCVCVSVNDDPVYCISNVSMSLTNQGTAHSSSVDSEDP